MGQWRTVSLEDAPGWRTGMGPGALRFLLCYKRFLNIAATLII